MERPCVYSKVFAAAFNLSSTKTPATSR
jgi:hypothetical protein